MRLRREIGLPALLAVLAALLPASAAAQIKVWREDGVDLSTYRTYTWGPCVLVHDDLMMKPGFEPPAVKAAIDRQLKAKGRELVLAGADAQFTCRMSTHIESSGSAWHAYEPVLSGPVAAEGTLVGYLVVGMEDSATGKTIWLARLATRVTAKPGDLKVMRKAVEKFFEDFPKIDPPAENHKALPLPGGKR